jgi:hypothetical protein
MKTNSNNEPQCFMTSEAAVTFLNEHPKMISDLEMKEKDLSAYCNLFDFLIKNPSPECIPLFFNSLNKFSNEYLVQMFTNVLKAHTIETVIEEIIYCLECGPEEAKAWVGEYIYDFPDKRFVPPLAKIIQNKKSSAGNCLMAVNVLRSLYERFGDEQIKKILDQDYYSNSKWAQLHDIEEKCNKAQQQFELNSRIKAADLAFTNKDYLGVVRELEAFKDVLPELVRKKYLYSKKKTKQPS